ncbi:outer-membrane lipoprotein carrier protein LolA [Asticcacaulis sp. EMRT-3]|uniref:LolA family protein n=1 Tax=Asticcacaulis sp. EMRT-3 TaxID=3040349 RepID=UPI0024AF813F|nr:outer-membrane lipoprotein carrier protein LolA [Asticcacaulis sp. EMRT-3]MDI7775797.1 outer-membrane lipoprotein carrier protein LolA [Asticcacaulis sp. EMRT-3]
MSLTRRLLLTALAAAALSSTALPVMAQSGKNQFSGLIAVPSFNAADKARIAEATRSLQDISSALGRFEQTDYRGRITHGTWYLQRPGKMRFEYDPPYSVVIVSDGKTVSMWDPRLETVDRVPLSETPLSLFLARQVRLDQGVVVTAVTSDAHGFFLRARDRRQQVEGSVTLGFDQLPGGKARLREWTIIDAQNRSTNVRLTSYGPGVNRPDLFVLNKHQVEK